MQKVEVLVKYTTYLALNEKTPQVGDIVLTVHNGNFTEVEITSIDENGWLYIFNKWLIGIEGCYVKEYIPQNCITDI